MSTVFSKRSRRHRPGFLLVEVLLGIVLFGLFLFATGSIMLNGRDSTVMGGNYIRGTYMSQRAIEAARSIREWSFSSVSVGDHGIGFGQTRVMSGALVFQGVESRSSGGYITKLSVSSMGAGWVGLSAATKWKYGYTRTGSVLLTSELTDWRTKRPIGNWASVTEQGGYTAGSTVNFSDVAVAGNYAYVTSETSVGLYILDISNLFSPTRVGSEFNIGSEGRDVAVKGKRLYVLTSDSAEVKVYNITNPTSPSLVTTGDIQGSGRGKAMALKGNYLYTVSQSDGGCGLPEMDVFDVSNPDAITYVSGLCELGNANWNDIAIYGTGAYIATSNTNYELRAVNIANPANLRYIVEGSYNGGYNVTGSDSANAIAVSGTAATLGINRTANGLNINNMMLFNMSGGGIPVTPGPWAHNFGSGSAVGVDVDPLGCYGFIAAGIGRMGLQVVDLRNLVSLPRLASFPSSLMSSGRGVHYDPVRDRVYYLTTWRFIILSPGSPNPITGCK